MADTGPGILLSTSSVHLLVCLTVCHMQGRSAARGTKALFHPPRVGPLVSWRGLVSAHHPLAPLKVEAWLSGPSPLSLLSLVPFLRPGKNLPT